MTKIDSVSASDDLQLRNWTRNLSLWYVCDNAACRRARACRGNVQRCFGRNAQRVPKEVCEWLVMLAKMQRDEVPFDKARARLDKTPVGEAFNRWHTMTNARRGDGENSAAADDVSR